MLDLLMHPPLLAQLVLLIPENILTLMVPTPPFLLLAASFGFSWLALLKPWRRPPVEWD